MTYVIPSLRFLILISLLTGIVYPTAMTVVGKAFFAESVSGCLIRNEVGEILGSKLIGQRFENARYFHSRPSAGDFATVPSGASNLGPTNAALLEQVKARKLKYGENAPPDLLTASGSGLDPHLPTAAIEYQLDRVMKARNLGQEQKAKIIRLIEDSTTHPLFGFIGLKIVNVLELNIAMDKEFR